jgi:hypothetical protein
MDPLHLANFGLSTNQYGGVYIDGVSYGITTRIRVAKTILERRKQGTYSLRSVAKEMQVGKGYVSRVAQELDSGGIIDPRTARHHCERGPGSLTLDDYDLCVLILLLRENPSRSLESYCRNLFDITGTIVSTSTVSRVWSHAFELKASFLKPNLVPRDKFKYENVARAREFIDVVQRIDPVRLKFCDEKHLKGAEIYNQKCRRDPLTGVVADLPTDSDFRNTWTIIGFCGYDMSTVPFYHQIREFTNTAESFAIAVEGAIAIGFLKEGDILVLDNASIHIFQENAVLEEWLWDEFGILLLTLPTRSPEMNPIEQLWNTLVRRMKALEFEKWEVRPPANDIASAILDAMSHLDVYKSYKSCGY